MPVHEYWLGNDGVIIENLARLTELPERVDVAFLPLRIAEGDGSPIRAVAFV
jgi:kynurenine formamidase